jgi:hypothetical protein
LCFLFSLFQLSFNNPFLYAVRLKPVLMYIHGGAFMFGSGTVFL